MIDTRKLKQSAFAFFFTALLILSNSTQIFAGTAICAITFDALPVKTFGDADFTLSASSPSGLPVTFTSSDTNTATVADGTVHIKRAGVTVITAVDGSSCSYPVSQPLWIWSPAKPIVAWGDNSYRQMAVPTGLTGVVAVSAGDFYTVALKSDGTLVAWGDNNGGQTTIPTGLTGVVAVAAGGYHTAALKSNGTVVAWGLNTYGQTTVPTGLTGVVAVAARSHHTIALKSDGTVVAWGMNTYGETTVPTGLTGVVAVAAGNYHTVALKSDGTVVAWGDNSFGETTVPAGLTGVVAVTAGFAHTVALKSDGTVVAWGYNTYGQTNVPTGLTGVVAVAAGDYHTATLKSNGTVVSWGDTTYGQTTVPAGLTGVAAVTAGAYHTVALGGFPQTITFDPLPVKTFGDADFALSASSSSGLPVTFAGSDTNTATVINGKVHIKRAGVTVITASQESKDSLLPAAASQTLTINKAPPVITWSNPSDITYGTLLDVTQLNATANVDGALNYSPATDAMLDAGNNQSLKVNFVPNDTADYDSVSKTVSINVLERAVTIKEITADNKIYDGTAAATLSGGQLDGVVTGDNVTLVGGTCTFSDKNIGTGKTVTATEFKLGGADSANYTLTQPSGISADITPATLTIKADDAEKDQNKDDPVFNVTYNGFVPGDDSSIVSGLVINRESGESPGTYTITPSGASAANYQISYSNGTLTIKSVTSVLNHYNSNQSKSNRLIRGIYIRSNPVSLSSGRADIRIVTNCSSDMRVIIYDAVGNAVYDKNGSSYTGTLDISWNLYTKNGNRAYYGTYLIVAKVKSRSDGTSEILKASLGLKP